MKTLVGTAAKSATTNKGKPVHTIGIIREDVEEDKKKKNDTPAMVQVEFHDDNHGGSITRIEVPAGTKIVDAASKAGVVIPTLCHHPRLDPIGKCGMCVVHVEDAAAPTQLACSTYCRKSTPKKSKQPQTDEQRKKREVMKVHVNGPYLNGLSTASLRRSMEHSMTFKHFEGGGGLSTGGTLEIEELGNLIRKRNVDTSSNAIMYDDSLCVGCTRCFRACNQSMQVLEVPIPDKEALIGIAQPPACVTTKSGRPLKDTDCISCGQCSVFCPTGAIKEVDHIERCVYPEQYCYRVQNTNISRWRFTTMTR